MLHDSESARGEYAVLSSVLNILKVLTRALGSDASKLLLHEVTWLPRNSSLR